MNIKLLSTSILTLASILSCIAQRNEIYRNSIRTLQVICGEKWQDMPIMQLNDNNVDNVINIDFDDLTHTYCRYTYKIEHCEADWSVTNSLFPSDYIEGFHSDNTIDDVIESINTNVIYTHYRIKIPNEKCRLKMSGNYKLTVIDDNDGDEVLAAYFMVAENATNVSMSVSTNTDIDTNKSHQQIEINLNYNGLRVTDPQRQIKTAVLQNGRWDNAKINVRQNYSTTNGLQWTHNRGLIFDAGNEYHKFETLSTSHPTLGVDHIAWDGQNYHAYLVEDVPRPNYLYDEDANGAFFIRNSDNNEIERTCDYMYVHFILNTPQKECGEVYLNGMWTYDRFLPEYKMSYNSEKKRYEGTVLLKQGYYSYQYVKIDNNEIPTIMPTEGSYFQTENKYQSLIYYRGNEDRTDRLVGYCQIDMK